MLHLANKPTILIRSSPIFSRTHGLREPQLDADFDSTVDPKECSQSEAMQESDSSSAEEDSNSDDQQSDMYVPEAETPFDVYVVSAQAQKLLDDLLDKNIEMVTTHIPDNDNLQSDGGLVKLFRKAPPGMRLDPIDQKDPGPQKKPKIIPGEYIDEKSKKFRRNIQSVAVNGSDIVAAARLACQSSFARWEARDTAAKAAAKREEERVAELKRIRGEEWLPSVAREMKVSFLTTMKLHASEHLDGNIV